MSAWVDAGDFLAQLDAAREHEDEPRRLEVGPVAPPGRAGQPKPEPRPAPERESRPLRLSLAQAEEAVELAMEKGNGEAAAKFGVSKSALGRAWKHYGIEMPKQRRAREQAQAAAKPGTRLAHGRPVLLTREQAQAAVKLAARTSVVEAAHTYGVSQGCLYSTWRRYEIPPTWAWRPLSARALARKRAQARRARRLAQERRTADST